MSYVFIPKGEVRLLIFELFAKKMGEISKLAN